jgi:methylthioribulose-1-phosphate dehydratase
MNLNTSEFHAVSLELAKAGRLFYERGWVFGTAGNFSAVVARQPLRLAITASGLHKGELKSPDFLLVDERGAVVEGNGAPSAETLLHVAIAQSVGAGAIFHTHSVWATVLSDGHARNGSMEIEGYEMLKGLRGVTTHQHCERVPILENTQDYPPLAREIERLPEQQPAIHGFLLRRHGLYTWGKDISEARRHVEILEFLFEVLGRQYLAAER